MNKDLEKEYKELMTNDVPDLWERIEAGLEPKQPAAEKVIRWRNYRVWGAAAAACLCLAVTVPALILANQRENSSNSDSGRNRHEDGFESAAAPQMEYDAEYSETDGFQSMLQGNGTNAGEGGDHYNMGMAPEADAAEEYHDAVENAAGTQSANGESTGADKNEDHSDSGTPSEGEYTLTYTVTAKVLEVFQTESKIEYLITVEEAPDGDFSVGSSLSLWDYGFLEDALSKGDTYVFYFTAVRYDGMTEYVILDIDME